jgi:hypothetical protein
LGFRYSISHAVDLLGVKGVRVRVCFSVVREFYGWLWRL